MINYIFAKYIKNWVFYMDQQKIDLYIMTNQKYFPEEKIVYLKDKLRTIQSICITVCSFGIYFDTQAGFSHKKSVCYFGFFGSFDKFCLLYFRHFVNSWGRKSYMEFLRQF